MVSWERSPHSARKVRVKACKRMGESSGPRHPSLLRQGGVVVRPCSGSEAEPWASCYWGCVCVCVGVGRVCVCVGGCV